MPTAETTLIPASGTNQRAAKRSLTSDARLDNETNFTLSPQPSGAGMKLKTDIIASDSASLPPLHYLLHTDEPRIDCLQA
jgi:hypothetical protein